MAEASTALEANAATNDSKGDAKREHLEPLEQLAQEAERLKRKASETGLAADIAAAARGTSSRIAGVVATAFGCPYEGRVEPAAVVQVARRLVAAGCHEISIGDTIGVAVPSDVSDGSQTDRVGSTMVLRSESSR